MVSVRFYFSVVNYRDMPSGRIRQYSYKRINHLKVRLRRFQAVENENVPEKVYDIIKKDLRKRRIRWDGVFTTGSMPTLTNIMEILKNNKLPKYYNNIQQIYCGVTGAAPPTLTVKEEEKIIEMFQDVDGLYRKYVDRLNFFSYSNVFNKILRILKKEEHAKYFKLLKCGWKLREYDNIWKKICIEKGCKFYSSL